MVEKTSMISDLRSSLASSAHHQGDVNIHVRPNEVLPFVDSVRQNADSDKEALGFLPDGVYARFAAAGHLYIACRSVHGKEKLAGHLLFGATFPHVRIHQLFVAPEHRKQGVAQALLGSLTAFAEEHGYMDITARVASTLPANAAWEKLGFAIMRTKSGGSARNRPINIRVKELNTPTLFGYPEGQPVSGLPILGRGASDYTPVYAIDLNVFFDVVKRRPRSEYASQVIGAALDNLVRIVVTEEFAEELKRSVKPATPDPVYEFALQLPTIPRPDSPKVAALLAELGQIVFPDRAKTNTLTTQDNSDLVHLATAIHHSASGFITAEKALLIRSEQIEARYGLKIVHVEHLAQLLQGAKRRISMIDSRFAGNELRLSELTEPLRSDLLEVVGRILVSDELRNRIQADGVHSSHFRSLIVSLNGKLVCAALWNCSTSLQSTFSAILISDEDEPAIESGLDALLFALAEEATADRPALIELTIPKALTTTREVVLSMGYTEKSTGNSAAAEFRRFAIGTAIAHKNWSSVRKQISAMTGNIFSDDLPEFKSPDSKIVFAGPDGGRNQISIEDLETALSPTVLCSKLRGASLVPIRRAYADHLLNTSQQLSLLPKNAAALFHERVYYSTDRNFKLFTPGSLMIFYESGRGHGRSSAVAVARVRETAKVCKKEVASALLRHGVLDPNEIEALSARAEISATIFDNLIRFQNPVSLRSLRSSGCIDRANLVKARRLTAEQAEAIVEKGELRGR
jgi:GNAT superfamily N-acetyltransferase